MNCSRKVQVERLHRLLDMVRDAYCWGRSDLARALGRDPSSVYPSTPDAKLDFVERLARLLEWPIDAVVETIRYGAPGCGIDLDEDEGESAPEADFETLLNQAREAYKHGQYERTIKLARQMLRIAKTPTERAQAWAKAGAGWDGLGHYIKAIEALRCAVREPEVDSEVRRFVRVNLASVYYSAGDLTPAHGIAHQLVNKFKRDKPRCLSDQMTEALAYYVRGASSLRLIATEPDEIHEHASCGLADLRASRRLHTCLAQHSDRSYFDGIANTCLGGIIVAETELGRRSANEAVETLRDGLPASLEPEVCPPGDWLESYGWWCVFGTELAIRHLSLGEMQRAVAVFTSKLSEIADKMNNWAFREFSLTMKYTAHKKLEEQTGAEFPEFIDAEELRRIFGTMGRFPRFRPLGWEILQNVKVVDRL